MSKNKDELSKNPDHITPMKMPGVDKGSYDLHSGSSQGGKVAGASADPAGKTRPEKHPEAKKLAKEKA